MSEENKKTGVLYEILKEIKKLTNNSKEIQLYPAKRILLSSKQNNKICSIAANTPDVIESFNLIEPIGFNVTVGILPISGIKLSEYSDLSDKIIAVPLGIIFDEKFHNDKSLNKVHPPAYINGIRMLKKGRADAVAGAIPMLKYIAKKENISKSFFDKPLIMFEASMYLICNKSIKKEETDILKDALKKLKSNGKTQQILDNYFDISEN